MLAGVFLVLSNIKAYDSYSGHPFLTKQIAELYNKVYQPNLTNSQIQQLVQGSSDEDTAPRWINHFYDPITGKEWLGQRLGNLPEEQVRQISKIVFGKDPVSALNWAHNQELQVADYRLYQGNRAFESAVLFYSGGDKNNAYYNLGHILHLIEDMTVPAHTRQDSHFDMPVPELFKAVGITPDKGEPYENWAKSYTSQNQGLNLVDRLKENYQPICYSLDDCLTILAQYSNNNFFSSDTILDEEYMLPKANYSKDVVEDGKIVRYYYSGSSYLLGKSIFLEKQNIFSPLKIDYPEINQAYWDNLAPKAILAGVEVIKYFQEQVEKVKNEEIVIEKPAKPNFFALLKGISPWGELAKVGKFAEEVKQEFYGKLDEAWKELNLSVNDFYYRVTTFNLFSAFEPPTFSIEDTIFSEKIELPPDPFAEEDPSDNTDQILTGIVEYMTGVGGPSINFDFQDQEKAQEALDDIYEKLDILRQQALKLIEEYNSKNNNSEKNSENDESQNQPQDEQDDNQTQQPSNPPNKPPGGGGGGSSPVYSKILISEVQVTGLTDQKEEFVELYNSNTAEIDLTNWYLQKKTKTGSSYSSFVPNTLFSGKKIGANNYFVIARENSFFAGLANIITDNSLTEDNSLILKNPNGEVSDKLGFGSAQEYETSPAQNPEKGQSIGRKWDAINNIEQDTDNNLLDFEAQNPTPKAKNSIYAAPVNPPLPPTPPPTPTDITAPGVSFSLGALQTSLSFTINFDITDPITTVTPSGIDSYIFRWQTEGGLWQEDSPVKVNEGPSFANLIREFTEGQDETAYYFQVKAKDLAGNESDWQPETPAETKISIPKKVLINEIQIAGLTDEKEEFVELYNPSAIDIDLSGWYLQRKTKTGSDYSTFVSGASFSGKKIKSKGYFLIGREESSFVILSDMAVDKPLTEDNTLVLKNPNREVIDKVGWGTASDFEGNPAPNLPKGQSIQRKWDSMVNTFQDTDDNLADFEVQDSTPKPSSPKSYIEDATDYLNSMSSSGNVYYFNLKIKWGSNSPNLDFYDVQYRVNDGSWQDWALQTTETEKTYNAYYSMFTDYVYYFRVRAQDRDGNQGDWAEVTVDVTNPVIINEVALFGANASKDDQWIELYNRSDKDVDLTGWKIISGASGSISLDKPLQGIIPAKGYFLLEFGYDLEDGDDNISDIIANQVLIAYVSQFIELKNSNNRQIDNFYVPIGLGRSGWVESDFMKDGNRYSMERISPYALGAHHKNWLINNGITINGADRDGSPIYGTPGQQNSNYQIYTPLSVDFSEDTILPLSRSPYLFHSTQLSVHKDKTLTIEPGVVVKFYDSYGYAGLKIEGTLKAIGGSDLPIVFTSFFDDQYGGDIDGASGVTGGAGHWVGLQFTKDATNLSELDNVVVRYAGSLYGSLGNSGIRVDQVSISLKNSTVENNLWNGILLINSSSIIDNVNFLEHKRIESYGNYYGGEGVYIQGGSPQITNSYFDGNAYGVYINNWWDLAGILFSASPSLLNNSFGGNIIADIWDVNNPPLSPEP